MYQKLIKPAIDLTSACVLLVVLSPVLIIGLLLAAIDTRGNPIFIHQRPGYNEKPIKLFKFRTMRDEYDSKGNQLTNLQRVTRIGSLLRTTSIDELPQLFNVLLGEISLVGPRPLEMWYLPHYTQEQRVRHQVKPGITGLAQVSGRNTLSWEEKFELDTQYVKSVSLLLDAKILLLTCKKVFSAGEINSGDNRTMEAFAEKPKSGTETNQ
jgi:lipopolysaccharide/colanic/teichoic acid biosynthesis glycosyltransferase